jgi:hypothetical protein
MIKINALVPLHACHESLADYPSELPFLYSYADVRRLFLRFWRDGLLPDGEVREVLNRISVMDDALAKMRKEMPFPPMPLRGDAHFTCDSSNTAYLWIVWEDVCWLNKIIPALWSIWKTFPGIPSEPFEA